jgi:cytochrome c oxidase assembly factor CtaG
MAASASFQKAKDQALETQNDPIVTRIEFGAGIYLYHMSAELGTAVGI